MNLLSSITSILIMFSHLFNTYESVTPPPKSKKKDFMD
jgi:hypothetical protein